MLVKKISKSLRSKKGQTLRFFKDGSYKFKDIFALFMNIREKQILKSVIEIQKEKIGGNQQYL